VHAQAQVSAGPVLTFVSDTFDFGTVPLNGRSHYDIPYKNTGKQPLLITDVRTGDPHYGYTTKAPMQPGECNVIKLSVPTGYPRKFSKELYVYSNSVDRPVYTLRIIGTVLPGPPQEEQFPIPGNKTPAYYGQIWFDKDTLDLGEVEQYTLLFARIKYTSTGKVPLFISDVTSDAGAPVEFRRTELPVFKTGALVVKLNTAVAGTFCKHVQVYSNNGAANPSLVVIRGMVVPPVVKKKDAKSPAGPVLAFASDVLNLGTIPLNGMNVFELGFINTGTQPLIISNVNGADPVFGKAPQEPIAPGNSGSIRICVPNGSPGTFERTLTITSNCIEKPDHKIKINVTVSAVGSCVSGPVLTFKSDTFRFGIVNLHDNGTFDIPFINSGSEPLVISQVQTGDPHWGEGPKEPIPPGKGGIIKLHVPTDFPRKFNKTLTVISNSAVKPQYVIKIVGEVLPDPGDPVLEFGQDHIDLGKVDQQGTVQIKLTIKNTGKSPLVISKISISEVYPPVTVEPILPGATVTVLVPMSAGRPGKFNKMITVYSNARNYSAYVYLSGEVVPK
jgi:hypothetical protein